MDSISLEVNRLIFKDFGNPRLTANEAIRDAVDYIVRHPLVQALVQGNPLPSPPAAQFMPF